MTLWLIGCIPSQSIELGLGCALFLRWASLCFLFTNYWWLRILLGFLWQFSSFWSTYLGFLCVCSSGYTIKHLPRCPCPWTFSLNIGLNMLPSDSFISYLDASHGYGDESDHWSVAVQQNMILWWAWQEAFNRVMGCSFRPLFSLSMTWRK